MKINRSPIFTLALTILWGYISPMQAQSGFTMNEQQAPLRQLLVELGNYYNAYFTIEEGWQDLESMNQLEAHRVQLGSAQNGLQQTLAYLHQTVPNFTFEVNQRNEHIIHIIDSRLARQKGYGIEAILKGFAFNGSLSDLVTSINHKGVAISEPKLMDTHEMLGWDRTSKIEIKGQDLKVRDALSNFINLDGRRILWIARTRLAPGEVSNVYFLRP